jgi:DNA-binding SARP family transcriptional activator
MSHADPQSAELLVQTLGGFRLWRNGVELPPTLWDRDKALQLFQFFVTVRHQLLHKEQLIDQLWPALDGETGDRDFRVSLNAISRVVEPERSAREPSRFIRREGLAYGLELQRVWIDADAFEQEISAGNRVAVEHKERAVEHYRAAVALYAGEYLPERRYEDWTSAERERLETLALATMTTLANLLIDTTPLESLRLTQRALSIDRVWEDAYRIQMRAYRALGNRPLALRTYEQCVQVLREEFGIEPMEETRAVYEGLKSKT